MDFFNRDVSFSKDCVDSLANQSETKVTPALSILSDNIDFTASEQPKSEQKAGKATTKTFAATTTNKDGPKKFIFGDVAPTDEGTKKQAKKSLNTTSRVQKSKDLDSKTEGLNVSKTQTTTASKSANNSTLPLSEKKRKSLRPSLLNESVDLTSTAANQKKAQQNNALPRDSTRRSSHYPSKSLANNLLNNKPALVKKSAKASDKVSSSTKEDIKPSQLIKLMPVETRSEGNNLQEINSSLIKLDESSIDTSLLDGPLNFEPIVQEEHEERRLKNEFKKQILREKLRAQCIEEEDITAPEEKLIKQAEAKTEQQHHPVDLKSVDFKQGWNKLKQLLRHVTYSEY